MRRELCRKALGEGASLALGPCTQPGGACALQEPCLSPATPSHLPAWLPLRLPSARSRASPGCQACTGVEVPCWSFGVYEHGHFHDGMWVSQCECVCVCLCLGLTGHVCVSVTMFDSARVCMHPSLRSLRGRLPPPSWQWPSSFSTLPGVQEAGGSQAGCRRRGSDPFCASEEAAERGAPIVAACFRAREGLGASAPS